MKIGLLKEGKKPSDSRVVLTPAQVRSALEKYNDLEVVVQPSGHRCYSDAEYRNAGVALQEDLGDCDVLLGVKEVPIDQLVGGKTYCFFSHTIKEQPYNRKLLQAVLEKQIRLIDYECLTADNGIRVIAFGRWAGIVGAHNGLYTWGRRSRAFDLKRAKDCVDFEAMKESYDAINFPPMHIVTTGSGRVARGAMEVLERMGIRKVEPRALLTEVFPDAVYAALDCEHLYERSSDGGFELSEFFAHPERYRSTFQPYLSKVDLFINSIFWDPKAPAYFSLDDMARDDFRIRVIADITCDIAPEASVPSTIRPSTIDDPIYGFDRFLHGETTPFQENSVDVMAVDNLPNELPRDASESFGEQFLEHVLPEFFRQDSSFLDRATIALKGRLNDPYRYLEDYVRGK